jgi:probable HAF family extracellular repeat protein
MAVLKVYPMKGRNAIRPKNDHKMRRHASEGLLVLKCIGLIFVICFASAAFAQNRYQITRLPTPQGAGSVALGINNHGEVVGYSFLGEDYHAFLYSYADRSLDVGSFGGNINAACAINDAGQVTGYSQDGNGNLMAFVFSRNQPIAPLAPSENASASEAFGINNKGAVVGDIQSGTQNHRPALFTNGSVQDLGLGGSNQPDALETAYAINDAGQIVGRRSAGPNAFHAFSFANGNTTDFSTLGGANGEALAINKQGLVVGDSDTAGKSAHAFVFDHSQLKDLGTLPGYDTASFARGINNSGDIVGESDSVDQKRAFLVTKGQLVELDKMAGNLSEAGFTSLDVAYGINEKGWIVGYGTTTDNLTAGFIAVPESHGQEQPVSESNGENYDVFYTNLSAEDGSWVETGQYGNCFRPRVSGDWRPYRDGHWIWTDRGWYWQSNERFAWATYHYGRWVDIAGTGWCWVPGNQWAPAWVSWRESDDNVGWAPLPPEADVSANGSISSWPDSYYGIGPAAYVFISYAHWHEPSYAQYIRPYEQNAQIINESKNVTNIVTNNNVINNFGPPVQTVATKTNQNIQQVKLSLSQATDPHAKYGQSLQGNQLNVVAPSATLKPQATHGPPVQNRIANPEVEKGWQGLKPEDAEKLKKTVAEQNPPPRDLPKPTPFLKPQIGNQGQVAGPPTSGTGQKTPPNLVKPGAGFPNPNTPPGASPKATTPGKPVPPNLLGTKSSGAPPSATLRTAATPVQEGKPETAATPALHSGPANLATPKPASTPHQQPNQEAPRPTPSAKEAPREISGSTPTSTPHQQPNQEAPRPTPVKEAPREISTPTPTSTPHQQPNQEAPRPTPVKEAPREISTPTSTSTPHQQPNQEAPRPTPVKEAPREISAPTSTSTPHRPPNQEAPRPTPVKEAPREISAPKPTSGSTPHRQPVEVPRPAPEAKVPPVPRQEIKPPSQEERTPAPQPQAQHNPPSQSQAARPVQAEPPRPPQGGQRHEPGKATPTPTP